MKKLLLLSALFVFACSADLFAQDYMKMRKKELRIEHQKNLNELNNNINEKNLLVFKVDSLNRQVNFLRQRISFLDSNINKVQVDLQLAIENSNSMNNRIKELELELSDSNMIVSDLQTEILVYKTDSISNGRTYDELRNSRNFETFLSYFILTAYSEQSIDSLILNSSTLITKFTDSNIKFGRFNNPGAMCVLFSSGDYGMDFPNMAPSPKMSNISFYENKSPDGGFCEEASSPNGVYYKQIYDLPENGTYEPISNTGDWEYKIIPEPYSIRNSKKMEVNILMDNFISAKLYFVEYKNKWVLLYKDDCDCGA